MGETFMQDNPTCPACDFVIEEWWHLLGGLNHDGDQDAISCPECKRPLTVTLHCEYSFTTTTPEPEAQQPPPASPKEG